MDILIKNREMTKGCDGCPCQNYNPIMKVPFCNLTYTTLRDDRAEQKPSWCPLIPVPEHGDLIDKQKLLEKRFVLYDRDEEVCEDHVETYEIMDAPVVLERTT